MPWIEGIGDEVTVTVGIALSLCVLLAAWLSTGIREIPFISVIIVQLRRRNHVPANNANQSASGETAQGGEATLQDSQQLENTAGNVDLTQEAVDPQTVENSSVRSNNGAESENSTTGENEATPQEIGPRSGTDEDIVSNVENSQTADCQNVECSSSDNNGNAGQKDDCPDVTQVEESVVLTETELRRRRLDFLSGKSRESATDRPDSDNTKTDQESTKTDHESTKTDQETTKTDQEITKTDPETTKTDNQLPVPQNSSPSTSQKLSSNKNTLSQLASNLLSSSSPIDNPVTREQNSSTTTSENQSGGNSERTQENQSNPDDTGEYQSVPGEIRVRIKFLNDTQRLVTSPATETIGNFRRKHFSAELSESMLVRFIFNGQELRNDASTLQSHNINDNSAVHCLVSQQQQREQQRGHDDAGFDIGFLMFPLFGLLLAIMWYLRFTYRQFFNVTSTLTLAGITFLFLAAFISSLRRPGTHEHID